MSAIEEMNRFLLEENSIAALHIALSSNEFDETICNSYFSIISRRLQENDTEGASKLADKIHRISMGNGRWLESIADTFIQFDKYDHALKYMQHALTINFQVYQWHIKAAFCYEHIGANDIAIYHLQMALHFSNFEKSVFTKLLSMLRRSGRNLEADGYSLLATARLSKFDLMDVAINFDFTELPKHVGQNIVKARLELPVENSGYRTEDNADMWGKVIVSIVRTTDEDAQTRAQMVLRVLSWIKHTEHALELAVGQLFRTFDLDTFLVFQSMSAASKDWSILDRVCRTLIASGADCNVLATVHAELCQWEFQPQVWGLVHPVILTVREVLSKQIEDHAAFSEPNLVLESVDPSKILLIQSTLRGFAEHSVLRLIIDHAIAILRVNKNSEVMILSTDEVVPQNFDGSNHFKCYHDQIISECVKNGDGNICDRLKIVYCTKPSQMINYVDHVFSCIDEFSPHCIINYHGVADDSFIFSGGIYKKYPFIYHQTNILQRPRYDADLFLSNGRIVDQGDIHLENRERWVNGRIGFTPFKKLKSYQRLELPFANHSIIMVTVGNRLPHEISDNFCHIAMRALDRYEELAWTLVGPNSDSVGMIDECAKAYSKNVRKRIYSIPFEKDLRALYEHCSIYLNPFRAGGGTSIALAISEGMPIVCMQGCDIEMALPPEEVRRDLEDYEKALSKFIEDQALRERVGSYCRDWFSEKISIESGARHLLNNALLACKLFSERKKIPIFQA
ncbi:hypothetical protein [Azospirillum sp. Marseille-Q6669]